MNSDELRVLLVTHDANQGIDLSNKLRDKWRVVQPKVDIVGDGKRAVSDFREHHHAIVFVSNSTTGMDANRIAREITMASGEAMVFFLGDFVVEADLHAEVIKYPISNWTDFFNRIESVLPAHFQSRIGSRHRDPELLAKLESYAINYRQAPDSNRVDSTVLLVPAFSPSSAQSAQVKDHGAKESHDKPTEAVANQLSNGVDRVEAGVVALLVAVAIAARFLEPSDRIVSIQNITMLLSAVALIGITLGKSLEKLARK